jgi:hypothetical protein
MFENEMFFSIYIQRMHVQKYYGNMSQTVSKSIFGWWGGGGGGDRVLGDFGGKIQ